MPPTPTPTALITGCSSGIGYELLRLMSSAGIRCIGTALPSSYDALAADAVAQSSLVQLRPLDVRDFDAASHIVQEAEEDFGGIDILINNAGMSFRSVVEDMNSDDEYMQMAVNYLGPMHLIRACLPSMRRKRAGRIINISSVGGMMAMPTMASYSASKFALEGASEALWYEMKPWNIKVTLVRPGFINSLAFKKVHYAQRKKNGQSSPEYAQHYEQMTRFVEKIMTSTPCKSENVARRILQLVRSSNPPLRAAGTPDALLFSFIRRVLPRFLYHKLLYTSLPEIKSWGPPKD